MYLKSITLKGFKSFPDRTTLEFGRGTSVIVGPNGSGKSNITDAVLWALGEQSPLAVRGQAMQDVIFGGAPGRQMAQSASVELVLDDQERSLGLGPEVSIYRRLDRTGEGEYRLSGARCRLIDLLEVLSDTGLGKEMHSVISQGRVEAIVTSRPRDRRLLIEEAAGLGKHRKRRRRAQLKLGHTQDNLDRALDVEREARSRLRPLKRQAEAAELHERLRRQTLEAQFELARDDLRQAHAESVGADQAALQARAARTAIERELERVAGGRRDAEEALAARSSHREELSRRSYVAQSAADRIGYRAEAVSAAAAAMQARLARARAQLEALVVQDTADAPDPAAMVRIAELTRELDALERDREAELSRQLEALYQQLAEAEVHVNERLAVAEAAQARRELAEQACERARAATREAERDVEAARRQSAQVGGELAAANQFLRSHELAAGGVRSLADELTVSAGFELAVAAALDGRLGAAVLDDLDAATALLDHAGRDGGRALIAGRVGADRQGVGAPPVSGAQRLADHVSGEGSTAQLARALLADVWVVDDLGVLTTDFSAIAVTRSGRVFSPGIHELRQAAAVGEERILAQRNRREELIAASEAAVRQERAARAAADDAAATLGEAEAQLTEAVSAVRAARDAHDEAAEAHRRLEAAVQRRRSSPDDGPGAARRAQLQAELRAEHDRVQRAERERAQRTARVVQLRALVASDEHDAPELAAIAVELESLAAAVAERKAEFDAELASDREAGDAIAERLKACAQEEAVLQTRLNSAGEALTGAEVRAQRCRDRAEETEQALSALAAELELAPEPAAEPLADELRHELQSRLERLHRRREQLGPVNPLAQEEYAEALAHVEELEAQRADLETAIRELERLIRDTDKQIRETFEQTFEASARNFEELVARVFPGGSGRLRLVSESDRQARVIGAEQLPVAEQVIDAEQPEADDEVEQLDADDLLGVEIEITPAGKSMKRLSLLSGGEKSMTALAFLFAVFLARPCPFYIMDEVEAALDDLNISHFLELLDTYSEQAQFIVVTHQKRTMEAADSLYGVSMGGDGISRVISRRLPAREAAA